MIKIYGAGLAGLLAGNILRRHEPVIYEAQEALPNNHSALLRFRSDAAQGATGIPFKKVRVQKGVWDSDIGCVMRSATLQEQNQYSQKVTGGIFGRSLTNLDPCDRYIAPEDFILQVAKSCTIFYGHSLNFQMIQGSADGGHKTISTIPMPVLMDIVGWPDKPAFNFLPIWTVTATITLPACDVYQTVYLPDAGYSLYRASITGDKIILEFTEEPMRDFSFNEIKSAIWRYFSIDINLIKDITMNHQKYGKLQPIDDNKRKQFLMAMTNEYNIYSVGRFATWRQLLLDDIIQDIHVVERLIEDKIGYESTLNGDHPPF